MTENERFGRNLSELMKRNNISGNKLAKKLEITPSAVSQYRNGRTVPTEENLRKIAEIFSCSTDFLLGRNENPSPSYDMQNACRMTGLTEDAIDNISRFRNYYEDDTRTGERIDYKGQLGEIISENLASPWLRPLLISVYNYKHCRETVVKTLTDDDINKANPLQSIIDMQRSLSSSLSEVIYNFTGMIEDTCKTDSLMTGLVKEEAKLRSSREPSIDINELNEYILKGLYGE